MAQTADDTMAVYKAALYGIPKNMVPEVNNARMEKLYDDVVDQLANGDKMLDIPAEDPDLRGSTIHKFVYEEK